MYPGQNPRFVRLVEGTAWQRRDPQAFHPEQRTFPSTANL